MSGTRVWHAFALCGRCQRLSCWFCRISGTVRSFQNGLSVNGQWQDMNQALNFFKYLSEHCVRTFMRFFRVCVIYGTRSENGRWPIKEKHELNGRQFWNVPHQRRKQLRSFKGAASQEASKMLEWLMHHGIHRGAMQGGGHCSCKAALCGYGRCLSCWLCRISGRGRPFPESLLVRGGRA